MDVLKMALLCLLVSSFVSCSKFKKWKQDSSEPEVVSDFGEGGLDGEDEAEEGVEVVEDETVDEAMDKAVAASEEYADMESKEQTARHDEPIAESSGEMREYTVQANDTLMWISFKIYGNYLRWRELLEANPGLGPEAVKEGMKIQYQAPSEEFNWNPEGSPYLIIGGDTLGIISNKVYGTTKRWEGLWNNNKQMIKDPNLIFAGFTIYYLEEEKLALNSQ